MFDSIKLKTSLAEANKTIEGLQAGVKDFQAQLEAKDKAVKETMEQAKADAETFATEKAALNKVFEDKMTEYQSKIDALTKTVEEAKESANKEAAHIVTAMGVDVGTVKETISSELTPLAALSKLESMPAGKERTEFYEKNKALILRAARS